MDPVDRERLIAMAMLRAQKAMKRIQDWEAEIWRRWEQQMAEKDEQ